MNIDLSKIPTTAPEGTRKKDIKAKTKELCDRLADLQHILYGEGEHSVLVVFQGMDASGKDGATKNVFNRCSPSGVRVISFKKPTEEEFDHDFLWRIHKHTPGRGMIQVFNRSHYEDVLIQRVHKWISEDHVDKRIAAINAFEELLEFDNKTTVIKCYMHLSQERQKEKLQERMDVPRKNWKHNPGDWKEHKLWDQYQYAYQDVINRSSIPWNIIPVDQRWYRDYCIAKLLVEKLEALNMELPTFETHPELTEE